MARKKKHHEEHENHERWLVSYADFMTLLFAFFVVMYAVSRVDNKRLVQVQESIRWAMHFSGTGGTGALPIFDGPPSEGGGPAMRSGSTPAASNRPFVAGSFTAAISAWFSLSTEARGVLAGTKAANQAAR